MVLSIVTYRVNMLSLKAYISYSEGSYNGKPLDGNEKFPAIEFIFPVDAIAPGFLNDMSYCTTPDYELNQIYSTSENTLSAYQEQLIENFEVAMDDLQNSINEYSGKLNIEAVPTLECKNEVYELDQIQEAVSNCLTSNNVNLKLNYNFILKDSNIDGVDISFDNSTAAGKGRPSFTMEYQGNERTSELYSFTPAYQCVYLDYNSSDRVLGEAKSSIQRIYKGLYTDVQLFKGTVELTPLAEEIVSKITSKYNKCRVRLFDRVCV